MNDLKQEFVNLLETLRKSASYLNAGKAFCAESEEDFDYFFNNPKFFKNAERSIKKFFDILYGSELCGDEEMKYFRRKKKELLKLYVELPEKQL